MPMLGDILAEARRSSGALPALLAARAPELAAEVAEAGRQSGGTPTAFVRVAVADFARFAAEEDWLTLTSRLRDSADPGFDCLIAMVEWRLEAVAKCAHALVEEEADGEHAAG